MKHKKEEKKAPNLRFPGFEGEWEEKRLGELCSTFKSGTGITSERISDEGEYPVYGGNGLRGYTDSFTHAGFYVLIGRQGALCGNINRAIGKSYISEHAIAICSNETSDTEWLAQKLDFLKLNRLSESSAQPGLAVNRLVRLKLIVPSRSEQQKIASFLSAVDKKIQQLTRKKELLEQYKKGVMQKIFSREIRFQDENGKDYQDWEEKQLSEFLIPTFREVPTPSKLYLAIGVRSHCRGTFQKPDSDPNAIAMDKLFVVKENDLILNITFAWEGAIAMVKKGDDGGLVSHRFPTYTFDRSKVLNEFFKYVFIQKRFRYALDLISPGGAGRNRVLSKKELIKIKWTMPLIEEQKKIASFLEIIDKKIEKATNQLDQTQQFKTGLLQQLFV